MLCKNSTKNSFLTNFSVGKKQKKFSFLQTKMSQRNLTYNKRIVFKKISVQIFLRETLFSLQNKKLFHSIFYCFPLLLAATTCIQLFFVVVSDPKNSSDLVRSILGRECVCVMSDEASVLLTKMSERGVGEPKKGLLLGST